MRDQSEDRAGGHLVDTFATPDSIGHSPTLTPALAPRKLAKLLQSNKMAGDEAEWSVLATEDWSFINSKELHMDENEILQMAAYEVAREAAIRGSCEQCLRSAFAMAFPGLFPGTPYLKIPPEQRKATWNSEPSLDFLLHQAIEPSSRGLTYKIHYELVEDPSLYSSPEPFSAEHLEMIMGLENFEDLKVRLAVAAGLQQIADLAGKLFRESMVRPQEDTADLSDRYSANVHPFTIDLRFSDDVLVNEFRELLKTAREGGAENPTLRFPPTDPSTVLKNLASTRLWKHFGTVSSSVEFLIKAGFGEPYIGESAWTKAKQNVRKMCEAGGRLFLRAQPKKKGKKTN